MVNEDDYVRISLYEYNRLRDNDEKFEEKRIEEAKELEDKIEKLNNEIVVLDGDVWSRDMRIERFELNKQGSSEQINKLKKELLKFKNNKKWYQFWK